MWIYNSSLSLQSERQLQVCICKQNENCGRVSHSSRILAQKLYSGRSVRSHTAAGYLRTKIILRQSSQVSNSNQILAQKLYSEWSTRSQIVLGYLNGNYILKQWSSGIKQCPDTRTKIVFRKINQVSNSNRILESKLYSERVVGPTVTGYLNGNYILKQWSGLKQ
jgi:hypothetical protein